MRALILVAGAALAVSACSSNEAAENTMNVDETLTTEKLNRLAEEQRERGFAAPGRAAPK